MPAAGQVANVDEQLGGKSGVALFRSLRSGRRPPKKANIQRGEFFRAHYPSFCSTIARYFSYPSLPMRPKVASLPVSTAG